MNAAELMEKLTAIVERTERLRPEHEAKIARGTALVEELWALTHDSVKADRPKPNVAYLVLGGHGAMPQWMVDARKESLELLYRYLEDNGLAPRPSEVP